MINKLYYYISDSYHPYHNQAIEEYFLNIVDKDSLILYLWQNQNTVFIGKNQSSENELNTELIDKANGYLARRISGGGAVYHDLGNINFTFISHKDNYNLDKQNEVILDCLKTFDIDAYKNGRNDLLINDRKFSGHAYYYGKNNMFHHGTIMLDVDFDALNNYLNVSMLKLKDKGVSSVKSRVINLKELNPNINIDSIKKELINSYEKIYDLKAKELIYKDFNLLEIEKLENKYSSDDWKYSKHKKHEYIKEYKYPWALVRIEYNLIDDVIDDLIIYTDSLNVDIIEKLIDDLNNISITELKNKKYYNQEEIDIVNLILEEES